MRELIHDYEAGVYSTEDTGLAVYVVDSFGTLVPLTTNFEALWYSMYESMDHSEVWATDAEKRKAARPRTHSQ